MSAKSKFMNEKNDNLQKKLFEVFDRIYDTYLGIVYITLSFEEYFEDV